MSGHSTYANAYNASTSYSSGAGFLSPSHNSYSSTGFGSPTQQGESRQIRQSLRPVTIRQMTQCSTQHGDNLRIDDQDVSQVTFVALIKNVSESTAFNQYIMEDGTGFIDARIWYNNEDPDVVRERHRHVFTENTYVRVHGQLRTFQTKHHVAVFSMRPITDFTEISHHFLEAVYVHLYLTRGQKSAEGQNLAASQLPGSVYSQPLSSYNTYGNSSSYGNTFSSSSSGYGNSYSGRGNVSSHHTDTFPGPVYKRVHQLVKTWESEHPQDDEGMSIHELTKNLGNQVGNKTVVDAVNWLVTEGHLYNTCDDDHLKTTD